MKGKSKAAEILDLFGLDGPAGDANSADPVGGVSIMEVGANAEAKASEPLPHALDMDAWGARRGGELLQGEFAENLSQMDLGDTPEVREATAADLFASVFEVEPELNESCTDATRHEFLGHLMSQDEYRAVRVNTMLNGFTSELAAVKFAEQLSALKLQRREREKREKKTPPQKRPGQSDAEFAAERGLQSEVEAMEAAARAVSDAAEEVEAACDASDACGLGGGADGKRLNPKSVSALYRRVKNDPQLKRICELAGRYRRLAQGRQLQRASHGYDDMVGVTTGDDVSRLTGSELAAFGHPLLRKELLLRLVEKQAFVHEHESVEPVGKGPIVVTVDESGSMSGEPVATAKALALAMAWIARSQRRWCCLVGFSGGTKGTYCVLPPNKWDEEKLCDWLVHFYGGGTTLDVPVEVVPRQWPELVKAGMTRGKTDIIMITDAIVHLPARMEESFLKFKKDEQVKLTALVIRSKPGDLAKIADDVHIVQTLGVGEEAVGKVVSI